jgi:hypothetical protein
VSVVDYEGATCSGQKHLRLTCGWRNFAQQQGLQLGALPLIRSH